MFASGRIAVAPGAYDGLSARLVELAGFPAVYASGGAIARSAGVPDLGLISVNAIVDRLASMVDVVDVPIIADADTGYGNALNAQAAARAFERAGVAAFHLEDQTFPKKCGHYDDKSLVPVARDGAKAQSCARRLARSRLRRHRAHRCHRGRRLCRRDRSRLRPTARPAPT